MATILSLKMGKRKKRKKNALFSKLLQTDLRFFLPIYRLSRDLSIKQYNKTCASLITNTKMRK